MATAPRKSSGNVVSRRILVLVKRDMTAQTPRVIWQHEKPILEAIFGEGEVVEIDPKTLDEGYTAKVSPDMLVHNKRQDAIKRPSECHGLGYAFAGDVRSEYERLAVSHGMHADEPVSNVQHVYGRFQEGRFADVVRPASHEDMPEAQLREIAIAHGYIPLTNKDSSADEKKAANEARIALNTMSRDELLKLVDELAGAYA